MLLLNNADVSRVLTMSMCVDALDRVFHEVAHGDAAGMGRIDVYVPSRSSLAPYYRWAAMAGGTRGTSYVCATRVWGQIGASCAGHDPPTIRCLSGNRPPRELQAVAGAA